MKTTSPSSHSCIIWSSKFTNDEHSKNGYSVHILIDSGSTHKSLDNEAATGLTCHAKKINPLKVFLADGGVLICDSICRSFNWIMQGNDYVADELLLGLDSYDGRECLLRGKTRIRILDLARNREKQKVTNFWVTEEISRFLFHVNREKKVTKEKARKKKKTQLQKHACGIIKQNYRTDEWKSTAESTL